uniref:F-box domain-containing protein n=1 Tax=Strongyloides papillosus TaxID=174720 RepID=A0A0N5B2B1_STREA
MDVTKEISFMELMEVDGVRKHILKCFEKFSDIENLTKTCRCLCLLINRDKIWRDIMWFHDYPYLTVKYDWGFIKADETRILENIDIIKTKCSCKELAKGSRYYGETVTNKKQTYFTINLDIGINIPEEHTTLVQGIAEECMLNHQLRSDVEILYFENSCDIQQRSLLIECLSYMKHDSVKRIIQSVNILQNCQCLRNPNVWARDIFGGFPNLNEVVFYRPGENYQNYGFFGNGSTIKYIIKSLGKKRNGTIIFEDARYDDNDLVRNVEKIYGYCDRHGVRIKLEFGLRNNSNIKNFINITSHGNARFSIDNLITRHSLPINYSTPFLESVEIFSLYENLEKLVINFSDLTIINNIKDTCLSNLERYSLRNCRKLKSVELNYFDEDN